MYGIFLRERTFPLKLGALGVANKAVQLLGNQGRLANSQNSTCDTSCFLCLCCIRGVILFLSAGFFHGFPRGSQISISIFSVRLQIGAFAPLVPGIDKDKGGINLLIVPGLI
jgi:hypothetical protein